MAPDAGNGDGDANPLADAEVADADVVADADAEAEADAGDGDEEDAGACSGVADGTPCGDPSDTACNAADTCQDGQCVPNVAPDGAPCGDATSTECNAADTCLAGTCVPNLAPDGMACGDSTVSACSAADSCLSGVCESNHAISGTPCGDPTATWCNPADLCDGMGSCNSAFTADGVACYDCANGGGLCDSCSAGACDNAPDCAVSPLSVATPIVNSNGQDGNMFDIVAKNTVVITGFEGNIANTPNVTTQYHIYYKVDSHVGFETDPAAWTHLAGPLTITPNAPNTLTTIIDDLSIVIPAGQTYAFYLTNTADSGNNNRYSNGTATGNLRAQDDNIRINEGTGGAYPFSTMFFQARLWEGKVHYKTAIGPNPSGEVAVDGAMFDVEATNALTISALDVHLADGSHALEVYFRRGTHVGAETLRSTWTLLGSHADLVSSGAGALTTVPFGTDVYLASGEVGAFYVTTGAASGGVLAREGTTVGEVVEASLDATLGAGRAISGTFGAVGSVSVGEARFHYGACTP